MVLPAVLGAAGTVGRFLLLPLGIGLGSKIAGGAKGLLGVEEKSALERFVGLNIQQLAVIGVVGLVAVILVRKL